MTRSRDSTSHLRLVATGATVRYRFKHRTCCLHCAMDYWTKLMSLPPNLQSHNAHTKFNQKPPSNSRVESCEETSVLSHIRVHFVYDETQCVGNDRLHSTSQGRGARHPHASILSGFANRYIWFHVSTVLTSCTHGKRRGFRTSRPTPAGCSCNRN